MKKMKVGIIGCGTVTSSGHVPAYRQLGLDIVGVADSNKAMLKKIVAKRKYTDYHELLKQDLDIVSICTPPFLHKEICLEAAERGINILVEKPLALTSIEGAAIKETTQKNNVKLSVMHNYKFITPFMRAKKMLDNGELGRLLTFQCVVHGSSPAALNNWKFDENKSGSMILQWNHPLYLATWLGGTPKSVYAIGKTVIPNYPSVADLEVLINFSQMTAYIEMTQFTNCPKFACNITGTGASLAIQPTTFKVQSPSTAIQSIDDVFTSFSNLKSLLKSFLEMQQKPYMRYTWGSHYRVIKKFAEAIKNDSPIPADVDEGILSIQLAEAIGKSVSSGEKISLGD
jgi:predicted dehydrogenase